MPELPDVMIYVEALGKRLLTRRLVSTRVRSPFVVRTFEPPVEALVDRVVIGLERLGKRVVVGFEGEMFLVIHLMIAGRLRWFDGEAKGVGKIGLAEFGFASFESHDSAGTLVLTEASTQKRASLHVVQGREALMALDPGGLEVLSCTLAEFAMRLRSENHTLKRALTDPRLFSGIGNAYSDEILHAAGMSPVVLTSRVSDEAAGRLHAAVVETLTSWREKLRLEFGLDKGLGRFPGAGEITAFRPDFAVHGKFGQPCPRCGEPVRRIVYAANECNYCATCQTGGKVLADRSLSRLLKEDWQREME
jgi:formamidopyrimidine-DNA glycosylase